MAADKFNTQRSNRNDALSNNVIKGYRDQVKGQGDRSGQRANFDPLRYQEQPDMPTSNSWSFSASSATSNNAPETPKDSYSHRRTATENQRQLHQSKDNPIQHRRTHTSGDVYQYPKQPTHESGFSSQEEFSLHSTKKVLDFENDSRQNSLHNDRNRAERDSNQNSNANASSQPGFQTQELLTKVHAYLGQCQSPAVRRPTQREDAGRDLEVDAGRVEFGTPERGRKVCLTEQEVTQCVKQEDALSSRSGSDEERKGSTNNAAGPLRDGGDCLKAPLDTQRLIPIRQKTKNAVVRNASCYSY